jgi:4-amino-4-deoxy-L-arabinose transferase-like glycosyltransferase
MSRLRSLRSLPRSLWPCLAVALLNGLAWSLITPPFHVPDEMSHIAYVQYLAETGDAPRHVEGSYMSEEEVVTLERLRFFGTVGQAANRPVWTDAGQRALDESAASGLNRVSDGSSSTAVNNPPLFYALQVAPYEVASEGTLLDRLFAMRLLSVLLSALTVVAAFLFLRESFPGAPWAWPAGALAVAFQPLFGFISTGVNNDSGLYLAGALLFLVLARAFRRGLTPSRGAAIGAVVGLGLVTKLTFVAFVPAVALALLVLVWRSRDDLRRSVPAAAIAVALAALPVLAYLMLNALLWDRELLGGLVGDEVTAVADPRPSNLRELLSYTWQLYLPRLPFQADLIPGVAPRQLWLDGFIGRFGWLDYGFAPWVYDVGLAVAVAIAALAIAGVVRGRRQLRARWAEVAVYGLAALGLMLVIAQYGYNAYVSAPYPFEQARYLLPLLPLFGAVAVLAARAFGRRHAPLAGAVIVAVIAAHGLFSQLLTLSRYYG